MEYPYSEQMDMVVEEQSAELIRHKRKVEGMSKADVELNKNALLDVPVIESSDGGVVLSSRGKPIPFARGTPVYIFNGASSFSDTARMRGYVRSVSEGALALSMSGPRPRKGQVVDVVIGIGSGTVKARLGCMDRVKAGVGSRWTKARMEGVIQAEALPYGRGAVECRDEVWNGRLKVGRGWTRKGSPPLVLRLKTVVFLGEKASLEYFGTLVKRSVGLVNRLVPDGIECKALASIVEFYIPADQSAAAGIVRRATNPERAKEIIELAEHEEKFMKYKEIISKPLRLHQDLNKGQKAAVAHAVGGSRLTIIHGPPGTGKTTTIVEVIRQAVDRGMTVLVTAPSNKAVDTILKKYVKEFGGHVPLGRLGIAERMDEDFLEYHMDPGAFSHKEVVFSTCTGSFKIEFEPPERPEGEGGDVYKFERSQGQFDMVIVDEAGQSTEVDSLIAALHTNSRLVLAGDVQQLPPTVLSQIAKNQGFDKSLMERFLDASERPKYKPGKGMASVGSSSVHLTLQYRMHKTIMDWSSKEFYEGSLKAHPRTEEHTISRISRIDPKSELGSVVRWIDTAGLGYREQEADKSKYNPGEASLVVTMVTELLRYGVPTHGIGIITPYAKQVSTVKPMLTSAGLEEIRVSSVDGFQGQECEVVILSLVRSNEIKEIGFLNDARRLNVAVTRAKRMLVVIGDSSTTSASPCIQTLLAHIRQFGIVTTGFSRILEGRKMVDRMDMGG